jgi:aldehyde dehydrogenase (NAD+)
MLDKKVATPLLLTGTSSYIRSEPKGNVLILAPWNYPVNLTLVPLAGAIAAGNTVIIKPSEYAPGVSAVIKKLIASCFQNDEVTVIEGGVQEATSLLNLPFDHVFFTGSTKVGKMVMEQVSTNLSDITLELGGKCPAIIDNETNLKSTVKRILWAKMINSGQSCIAPDHILVHESLYQRFLDESKKVLRSYLETGRSNGELFSCIVSKKQYEKLKFELDKEIANGANAFILGEADEDRFCFPPVLLTDFSANGFFAEEEIFGPILPVSKWNDLDQLIESIQVGQKPLAIYIYSNNKKAINRVLNETSSGGVVVNHGLIQFSNPNLPFGGVNSSGLGKYHGKFSFETFSNQKAIIKQWFSYSASSVFRVPYSKSAKTLVEFMVRWL